MNEIVSAWGDNSNGQLGDGSTVEHHTPAPVKGLERVRKVAGGSGHAVALLEDGTALAWGRNAFGQLGDGTMENQSLPVEVKLDGIADISPGGGQTLFLRTDGTVWGCGAGFFGLLGPDHLGLEPVPVHIETPGGIVQLVSGGGHALIILEDGAVWSWGRNDVGQLGDGDETGTRPGSTTQEHAGRTYPARPVPAQVRGIGGPARCAGAGGGHSLVVLRDGSLYAWGDNDRGQLGDGTTTHQYAPVRSAVEGVREVAGAYHHTLALLEDGTVRSFGMNDRGQLGNGTTEHSTAPVEVKGLRNVRQIVTTGGGGEVDPGNYGHNLAVLEDGTLWAWGCNDHGELGDGTTEGRLTPVRVESLQGVRQVTVGGEVPAFRENPGGGFALAIHAES
jgi:alpha-tubulin suppressor-like RCC1 family protein